MDFDRLTLYNLSACVTDLPDDEGVLSMIRRRARDEKVNVRKAALQAVENVIRFEAPDYRRQVGAYHCGYSRLKLLIMFIGLELVNFENLQIHEL